MTDRTSIYLPADVADEIDEIHRDVADEWTPKYHTVRRAVRQLADDEGNTRGRGR